MAMSDCIRCWDTPCTCGYDYKDYPPARRTELAAIVLGIRKDTPAYWALEDLTPEHHFKEDDA